MNMVDPKQGPFHPKRNAARVDPSCHLPPNPSTKRAPEAESVGKQPFALNRQTSFVLSGPAQEMKMRTLNIAMLCGVAAVAIAGCSSDTFDSNNRETQSTAADYGQENSYMADTSAGSVMTTPNGMTVYTFDKDQPGRSSCYDDCAVKWPPVTADAYAQEHDRMTLITRTDGQRQWAYDGKPLYTYHDDAASGDAKGDNVGNVWHVVK